jgi:hypothetical protein
LLEAIGANRIVFKVGDLSINPSHERVITMPLVDAAEFLTEGLLPLQRLILWVLLVNDAPRLAGIQLHALIDFIFTPFYIKMTTLLIFWWHSLHVLLALDKHRLH